jgi:hypothetical protein
LTRSIACIWQISKVRITRELRGRASESYIPAKVAMDHPEKPFAIAASKARSLSSEMFGFRLKKW